MPDVPSAEELSALPRGELAVLLAEAYRVIADLTAQAGQLTAQVDQLTLLSGRTQERVEELERGKRRPGKQPGEPGTTMSLVDDPDERFQFPPAACCGRELAGEPVAAQRRHQVTDIAPAPARCR